MRSLLALTLLAIVAAHDSPISSIIGWLKDHDKEIFDAVEECRVVPAMIMNAKANKGCYNEKSTQDKAAMALWYAIAGLEHAKGPISEFAKHSPMMDKVKDFATMKVLEMAHQGADKFCGNANCTDQVKEVQSSIASCYASLTCTLLMDKIVPYSTCKDAIDKYMESTMQLSTESMCESDDVMGKTYYCAELSSTFMFGDFDCLMEMKKAASPGATCTPKCVKEWKIAEVKMPKCSKIAIDMTQQIFDNIKTMLEDMAKDAKIDMKKIIDGMPKHLPTYDQFFMVTTVHGPPWCIDHKPPQFLFKLNSLMV